MIELKELSLHEPRSIYDMIKEIGPGENGFQNSGYNIDYVYFTDFLRGNYNMARGIGLGPKYVPQTMYWLIVDNIPVGIGKLRSYLNDNLNKVGGHIGYTIRPSQRGKGYGNIILKELLIKAKEKDIEKVLITCNENNILSRKVIESNGGKLENIYEKRCRYWIDINNY